MHPTRSEAYLPMKALRAEAPTEPQVDEASQEEVLGRHREHFSGRHVDRVTRSQGVAAARAGPSGPLTTSVGAITVPFCVLVTASVTSTFVAAAVLPSLAATSPTITAATRDEGAGIHTRGCGDVGNGSSSSHGLSLPAPSNRRASGKSKPGIKPFLSG